MLFPWGGEMPKVEGEQAMWEEESWEAEWKKSGALEGLETRSSLLLPAPTKPSSWGPSPITQVPEHIIVP